MVWRWDCRVERVRWAEGGRVLRRLREPVVDVRRRERWVWVRRAEVEWVGEDEGEDEGEGGGGRRVRVVGKWPVWKVEIGRRRWPERDLGSRWMDGWIRLDGLILEVG